MEPCDELIGSEFDWFATDAAGYFAMFQTAGEGILPTRVHSNLDEHSRICEYIGKNILPAPIFPSDFADLGIFVYDWKIRNGLYYRESHPRNVLDTGVAQAIEDLACLPKYLGEFHSAPTIDVKSQWHATE